MARASNPTPLDFITGTYGTGMYEDVHADENYRGWGIYLDRGPNGGWLVTAVDRRGPDASKTISVPGEFDTKERAKAEARAAIDASGPVANPTGAPEPEHLSPPAKAALWIGSIATIIGGGALLLSYFWPIPPETLNYKGVVFNVSKSGGTWIASFSYGNQSYSINGSSVNDAIAQAHNQIDSLVEPTSAVAQASSAGS